MYKHFNPNPAGKSVGDCTVRAVAAATGKSWDEVYTGLSVEGLALADMPSANAVWGAYLKRQGYRRQLLPDTCPDCYTVADFAAEHPKGVYLLALSGHVVCIINGDWYDTWDSGAETPLYYWERADET